MGHRHLGRLLASFRHQVWEDRNLTLRNSSQVCFSAGLKKPNLMRAHIGVYTGASLSDPFSPSSSSPPLSLSLRVCKHAYTCGKVNPTRGIDVHIKLELYVLAVSSKPQSIIAT
jgi:hypothetical protein